MSSTPIIQVKDVKFVYARGHVVALDGVNLEFAEGQSVGIAGPNGSGKTTLTKMFNGLLRPTSGAVIVDGKDVAKSTVQQMAATIGYVFQNPNHQLFATSVESEIAFGPVNQKLPKDEVKARVEEAIEFFELEAHRADHPYRLSFPLRKLVGIASVFAMPPRVFVLDEPTTGQDHQTTQVINRLIHKLRDRGATVICVAHDMPLLADVSERLVVMWNAGVIADATPRVVFAMEDVMKRAHLSPPQVTQISLRLSARRGKPAALSVNELVADLRASGAAG